MPTESSSLPPVLTRAQRTSQHWVSALVPLALCWSAGCGRCNSEAEQPPSDAISATASPNAAGQPGDVDNALSHGSEPASPLTAPSVPPQLVACGEREFYRINQSALQVFEVADDVPPPHIRGSSVARQMTQLNIADPLNVFSMAKKRALVIAENGVFHYELGQTRAQPHAPIPAPAALVAWSDPRDADAFWVRTLGDASLRHYALSSLASSEGKSAPSSAAEADRVQPLAGFDSRLFTPLADGTPLFSTAAGLVRDGDELPAPFPRLAAPATLLFADAASDRYWVADARGNLGLWDRQSGESPIATSKVPGVVIDVAREGTRVAVLSLELGGGSYRPSVTIFENGQQSARLSIGPSVASGVQPLLDLCLIAGRPWVVVGGRYWLQILDWTTPRLLAEW